MKKILKGAIAGSLLIFISCQKQAEVTEWKPVEITKPGKEILVASPSRGAEARDPSAGPDLDRGRKIWISTCNQCHNKDPNIKGAIGPEVVDAPLEVMLSKVKTGKYPDPLPPGFVPKRKTSAMRPLPQYEKDVPSIWAYVQSVKKKK